MGTIYTVDVAEDGAGLVSHAGAGLLAEVADRVRLTAELFRALAGVRERRGWHDPGRLIRDLAVMHADGRDCLWDLGRSAMRSRCSAQLPLTRPRFG